MKGRKVEKREVMGQRSKRGDEKESRNRSLVANLRRICK